MILDNWESFSEIDKGGMYSEIEGLPDQLLHAWEIGNRAPLPDGAGITKVVIAGMGGSAIGGDLLISYGLPFATVPVFIWRNYDLPGFAKGPETMVICSSHSGNTEEVLSAFDSAIYAGTKVLAVTTGGELGKRAKAKDVSLWTFEHSGQPRAAVGFSFGLLLAAFTRLSIIPDPTEELRGAVDLMKEKQADLKMEIPAANNPAKRLAGQMMGRWPSIIGADHLAPVARRWRTQINEIAKAVGQFDELPEVDHNMVAGVEHPGELFGSTMVVFLRGKRYHPRNLIRTDVTKELLMVSGMNTDMVQARGESRLEEQWTSVHFGDYVAFYLAMANRVDPSPVPAIQELKREIA
jgi:glucose/mannose-6-phosphate isomerase